MTELSKFIMFNLIVLAFEYLFLAFIIWDWNVFFSMFAESDSVGRFMFLLIAVPVHITATFLLWAVVEEFLEYD